MPTKDKDGRDYLTVILKYTFEVESDGQVALAEEPTPIDFADTYNGEDASTASIRRPSQLFDYKPGTDVIVLGHAHPPAGREVTSTDVALRVGPIRKSLRVHGFRVWQRAAFGGLSPGPARPLRDPVPLLYELAWGGSDVSDPERPLGEPRNLAGTGVARDPARLVGQRAAQIEDPAHPLSGGRPAPAGFGAIHRHWQPRASFAGTYDEVWERTRMPLLPADFDSRFHVCVPPDQWSTTPLRGDEVFELEGVTPDGFWAFALPRVAPGFSSVVAGVRSDHRTHLDTVLVDADARRVELTWRASLPAPLKLEEVERVMVIEKDVLR